MSKSTADIQQNRLQAALDLSHQFNAWVVLKGSGSICATTDGRWFINPTGNPGMASAGMGDVLSGMIVALLAQSLNAEQALLLGVYLHGAAADACVENGIGPVGLTASEVTDSARHLLNKWIY
jgi:NAD(P)H-hydrate repair Nnr-like enzyme with NAD(P)H-hydrate dehydratase domain